MSESVYDYAEDVVKALKDAAKDNAIRDGNNDTGFSVRITKDDVKNGTKRKRIKGPVMGNVCETLTNAGFETECSADHIEVFVPPILGKKDIYTLDEIIERNRITEEIEKNKS